MTTKKRDWDAWLENPVTRDFFSAIAERRDEAQAYWDNVSWRGEDIWQDGKAYPLRAACKGRYEMAQDILNINFEEEEDNDESERDTPD